MVNHDGATSGSSLANHDDRVVKLAIAAIGVVFGDIGTSPLYAFKEVMGSGSVTVTPDNVYGAISLIFWTLTIILTIEYQFFITRADNKGEGGILAMVALAMRNMAPFPRIQKAVFFVGMASVALFFGDGVITPAISVLSAVEGLEVATPFFKPAVVPISLTVLCILFFFQYKGTAKVGALFGPVMIAWFGSLALIGVSHIIANPGVLQALDPRYGVKFLLSQGGHAMMVLGAVFLAVTGAEALYADMGHFGRRAINLAWVSFAFPALVLNYLGQGAAVLDNPEAVTNPFYLSVPSWGLYPMVALATMATVIASQAVISGAFSASFQAIQLGLLPRLTIKHTSHTDKGQIYVPAINWTLLVAVIMLILMFQSSGHLAAAYGIAVTGTMITVTFFAFTIVLRQLFRWSWPTTLLLLTFFMVLDLTFFIANVLKIPDGGWFSLLLGGTIYFLMSTWHQGQNLLSRVVRKEQIPLGPFLRQLEEHAPTRGPGIAVYMTQNPDVAPVPLVQLLRHAWFLHETGIILSVNIHEKPFIQEQARIEVKPLASRFYCVVIHFGFMEHPDVPKALEALQLDGEPFMMEEAAFFAGNTLFLPSGERVGMPQWRLRFFLALVHLSRSAPSFFNLPPRQVVTIGSQIVISR
ncbi:MAG: potassium transporter Kup [Magnetococcales bacterium]|nr:potassium transporter Kup [Magnetococcales bacterium]